MKTQFEIIGDRLKRIREQAGLSQAQLAKLCGWASQSRIANYEKGARGIGADDALILSKILKVSPGELLFGEQSPSSRPKLSSPNTLFLVGFRPGTLLKPMALLQWKTLYARSQQ
ncbi:helix-turn-helix domain-containing protein [Sodalis glossinidius]|uniref:helix-turn-helix domain-containing protein n=1 Tax=Sodalis glossinidius TaxID=63612 RepID=UPI001FB182F7|nr:helix-turn-helix transcriptional regulator [Sodalis glossinidius]